MNFDGNFRRIGSVDISALRQLVTQLPDAAWNAVSTRQQRYEVHQDTQTINLVHDPDFRHSNTTRHPAMQHFEGAMRPILDVAADYYDRSPKGRELTARHGLGYFVRANLVRLRPGGAIAGHQDKNFSLAHSHRVHVPIVTNNEVRFSVGSETIHMSEGDVFEVNNRRMHSVRNDGNAGRVHLILDYVLHGEKCCCGEKRHPHSPCTPEACLATDRMQVACTCFPERVPAAGTQPDADLRQVAAGMTRHLSTDDVAGILRSPTVIVSAPRSGSTLLFEQMARVPGIWTIGGESHGIFRAFSHLRAENAALDSGCLDRSHADDETVELMRRCFLCLLKNSNGDPYLTSDNRGNESVSLVEKTPRNSLNIPFLLEVFPDARFIFLHRDPRQAIASIVEAWTLGLQSGRFVTFADLPGWDRGSWCFLLPPGWRSMVGKSLPEIAAFQWAESNRIVLEELSRLPDGRWTSVSYACLVQSPKAEVARLCRFAGVDSTASAQIPDAPPWSATTITPPHADKWKKHEDAISRLLPALAPLAARLQALASR